MNSKKMNWIYYLGLFCLASGSSTVLGSSFKTIELSTNAQIPKSRWLYEGPPSKMTGPSQLLAKLKFAKIQSDLKQCLKFSDQAWAQYVNLRPWILLNQSQCSLDLAEKEKSKLTILKNIFRKINDHPRWLISGPAAGKLRKKLIEIGFQILDLDNSRSREPLNIASQLLEIREWLTTEERSRVYRHLGNYSFRQQEFVISQDYYLKSLTLFNNEEARAKLESVKELLSKGKKTIKPEVQSTPTILSPEEGLLVERMNSAVKSGELISAAQDGIELIQKFPGSSRADQAFSKIWEIYLSVSEKNTNTSVQEKLLSLMGEVDGKRLEIWSERAFNQGYYKDAAVFSQQAVNKQKGFGPSSALLLTAAKSLLFTRELDAARTIFKELSEKHSGTDGALQALLYLGLIEVLETNYDKAASYLEKLLSLPDNSNYELIARYWFWRSLQNTNKERATKEADIMVQKFPFSYYGLLAKAEGNQQVIEFPEFKKNVNLKTKIALTDVEYQSWERARQLLTAGWYEEAQDELLSISFPTDIESQALLARYLAASFAYPKAIELINKSWDEDQSFRVFPFVDISFPREFSKFVKEHAAKYNLSPYLVWGLIKQESAFSIQAVSRSGALGLMQLIPPTAREVATSLKYKNLKIPETLFDPTTNIRFGSYYLSKMVRNMEGNVALALASYNAGPTRLKLWLNAFKLTPQNTSKMEYDIWIDLLPWSETRFYVKAILRNWILYRVIEEGKFQMTDPVWQGAFLASNLK